VEIERVAVDAFGNALGGAFVDAMQPTDNRHLLNTVNRAIDQEYYVSGSAPATQGVGPWSEGDYVNEMDRASDAYKPAGSADAPQWSFADDVTMRQTANNPFGLPTRSLLATDIQLPDDTRVIRDFDPEGKWNGDALGGYGNIDDGIQLAAAGSLKVIRGNAVSRSSGGRLEVLYPIPSTVNGVSVNQRANGLIQAAADLTGAGDLYRDIKLIGALMSDMAQQTTLDKLKGSLQDKLGMMRVLPTEADLGAVQGIDSDGVLRWNKADLIDCYSDAVRKVELMKAGIIELDTRSMLIKSIGIEKLTPDQWVAENTRRYQGAFAVGMEEGQRRYDVGSLRYPADMPGQLQIGSYADNVARLAVIRYNQSIGVPEGPGQLLSMNRWSYDPSGSGLYNRIDMLMDLGPNRNNGAMILRTAIEGKSSLEAVQASASQLQRVYNWVTPRVITATPQGTTPWQPTTPKRLR
jgi:hypothetical protein